MNAQEKIDDVNFIEALNENDIICGRGGGSIKHLGNTTFRHLVNINKVRFQWIGKILLSVIIHLTKTSCCFNSFSGALSFL